jgi:hypothetical protein
MCREIRQPTALVSFEHGFYQPVAIKIWSNAGVIRFRSEEVLAVECQNIDVPFSLAHRCNQPVISNSETPIVLTGRQKGPCLGTQQKRHSRCNGAHGECLVL